MQINEQGYTLDTKATILTAMETILSGHFGSGFYIKPDGVMSGLMSMSFGHLIDLQDNFETLVAQFNPQTAGGVYQDALSERLGVERLGATKTNFVLKVKGAEGLAVKSGEMTVVSDKVNYTNRNDFMTNENGEALVDFESDLFGSSLPTADVRILDAPVGIDEVESVEDSQISVGRERESDEEYRARFKISKALNSKCTENANMANLNKYTDDTAFLNIVDKNDDADADIGTIKIIAHHNTTDRIFGETVFDTSAFGVELLGGTVVSVKSLAGAVIDVHFQNATEVAVTISAQIKIYSGFYAETVLTDVKTSILEYVNRRAFGLGSKIYATEFVVPILGTAGVETVNEIKISIAEELVDELEVEQDEVPLFAEENILLRE